MGPPLLVARGHRRCRGPRLRCSLVVCYLSTACGSCSGRAVPGRHQGGLTEAGTQTLLNVFTSSPLLLRNREFFDAARFYGFELHQLRFARVVHPLRGRPSLTLLYFRAGRPNSDSLWSIHACVPFGCRATAYATRCTETRLTQSLLWLFRARVATACQQTRVSSSRCL